MDWLQVVGTISIISQINLRKKQYYNLYRWCMIAIVQQIKKLTENEVNGEYKAKKQQKQY